MKKVYLFLFVIIGCIVLVLAAEFTPQGHMNLRGIYSIKNVTNITVNDYYGGSGELTENFSADYFKGNMAWTNLTDYPVSCPANSYITTINDSTVCSEVVNIPNGGNASFYNVSIENDLNVDNLTTVNNFIVNGNFSAKRPSGMFSSTQTQIVIVASTAYVTTFNYTENSYLILKSTDQQNFTIQQSGDYLIELSVVIVTDTNNKHFEVWPQINGVNVPRSNTRVEIENAGTEQVIAVPFILDLNAGDSFRIMYSSDDAGSQMVSTDAHGTGVNAVPICPSIIMTVTKISETI